MAKLNLDFYNENEDQLYSDGSIEEEMYERVIRRDATLVSDPHWAVFYHFSPLRENILNWYQFKDCCSILEVGAGCGALTGLLVRRGNRVTSCELTMNRARIIYERYKDAPNLEIYVGDINRIRFDAQFDYIIVNGVLEYAKGIMGDTVENPYKTFLEKLKKHLHPNGHLLLAIENRLGLKYLAGAPEDHCGTIYEGINGYPTTSFAKTFSKHELGTLCADSGFIVKKWYYPYPDYKFPVEIFTDESVNTILPSALDTPYDMPRAQIFDKDSMYRTLNAEKIGDRLANSFLIDLGHEKANAPNEHDTRSYIKISNNRKKSYAIYTAIDFEKRYAIKAPLYPEARAHIDSMLHNAEDTDILHYLKMYGDSSAIFGDLVIGNTLRQMLDLFVTKHDLKSFWNTLSILKDELLKSAKPCTEKDLLAFGDVFGNPTGLKELHWIYNGNIDLNADNIFVSKKYWTVIDNEWIFSFPVPIEFILWRLLKNLRDYSQFQSLLSNESICDFLGVTTIELNAFVNWEHRFAYDYVGMQDLSCLQQPIYKLDINQLLAEVKRQQVLVSHLFVFLKDHDESNPLILESIAQRHEDRWIVRFETDILANAKSLRWDPLEGNACEVWDIHVSNSLTVNAINAVSVGDRIRFETFDPQFSVCGDWSESNYLEFSFQCQIIDWSMGYRHLEDKCSTYQKENTTLQRRILELQSELQQKDMALQKNILEFQKQIQLLNTIENQLKKIEAAKGTQKLRVAYKVLLNKKLIDPDGN